MAMRIPEKHKDALVRLAALDDESQSRLLKAFENSNAEGGSEELAESVAISSELPKDEILSFLEPLISMGMTRYTNDSSEDEFLKNVIAVMPEALQQATDKGRFQKILKSLLSTSSIRHIWKTAIVMSLQERMLLRSRIIVDLRPIFNTEHTKVESMTSFFRLQLTFEKDDEESTLDFALNVAELEALKRNVDVALTKHDVVARVIASIPEDAS